MDLRANFWDLNKPNDMLALKRILTTLADECDILYSTSALNGAISARQGRIGLYNNSGTYTTWINLDGATTWRQIVDASNYGAVTIGDGGGTDYLAIAADGTVTLHGDARVTKELQITAASLAPGSTGPDAVILGNYLGYSYDINDDSVANFEVPYDWDSSTNLSVIIYWYINEARSGDNQEVQWQITWGAVPTDASEALDSPTHSGTIDYGDQLIPTTAKTLTKTSDGTIAAASLASGDLIGLTIKRIALDGGNNPTADPVIVRIEIEYTSNVIGE